MPIAQWKDVVLRSWHEAENDAIGIIAAGVAFWCFLALVPMLGVMVMSYGLLADPATIVGDAQRLASIMPPEVSHLMAQQMVDLVRTSDSKKGLGLISALAMALFGARNGAGSIIAALNIAYEVKDKRGFFALNGLILVVTMTTVVSAIVAALAITVLVHLQHMLPGSTNVGLVLGKLVSYALLGLVGTTAAALLYRYGPARTGARWTWITPGSLLATICWILLTAGFGAYVARIGDYNATYGSLSAVVVLLTWLYLSSYALLFGAELNCEVERVRSSPGTSP